MAVIVTRETTQTDGTSPKGSPLTNAEVDANFINLNDNKVEVSGAIVFEANAGEALTKGDAVYVSGISGNKPVVSKADADDASKMPAFGLAETDATLNSAVNVVTFGTIYELDTSGFSAGDTVYVSTTAGVLSNSAPTGESSLIQNMGKVIRSHASAGSIKVGGAGRTNATPNLNDGNVFIGNASNQSVARALTASDIQSGTFADARIAESNVTQHEAALSITESQISDLQSYLTSVALNDVSDVTITSASSGQVLKYNGSAWINDTDAGGIEYTDLSVTTNAAGTAALSYNNANGVFTYTPPDLSSYLTSYTETDPVFSASASSGITSTNISNWNTAYGWGDHASAGYLTSYTETDPVFSASAASGITSTNITNWNTAYGWGNHASAGYLTSFTETDPTVPSHVKSITTTEKSNWNTAYGWGNHASAGYALTSSLSGYVSRNFEDSSRNLVIPTNTAVLAAGLALESSAGNFLMQLYGTGSLFGFLDAQWGNWDLKKTSGGQLEIDVGGTLQTVWHTGNDGSGSGLDADNLDGYTWGTPGKNVVAENFNVVSGNGKGLRFWDGNTSYQIVMSAQGVSGYGRYTYEPNSDYNMYFRMAAGVNRGFVFQNNTTNVANIDASGNIRADGVISSNNKQAMNCAHWSANATTTGAIKITLPGSYSSAYSMPVIEVTTYRYSGDAHVIYTISGHNWNNGVWYNTGVTAEGGNPLNVRLGHDGTNDCIIIGDTNTSWSYGSVTVALKCHPSIYASAQNMTSGWGISQITSLPAGVTVQTIKKLWHTGNDGSGSGLDADTVDGIQGASFLRSDADDAFTGNLTTGQNNYITFGPNSTWNSYLRVGGNGRTVNGDAYASMVTTNGNLHLDAGNSRAMYLNYYAGTAGVGFGSGGSSVVAWMGPDGDLWKGTADNSGSKYWHAGNDGSGSGLDADLLDGLNSSQFLRSDAANNNYSYVINLRAGGAHLGNHEFAANTNQTAYSNSSIELREANYGGSSSYSAPRISFHWGGVVASSIAMNTSGHILIQNNPGTGYETFRAGTIYSSDNLVWHAGNDGSGSGLDADTLDGYQGSNYIGLNNNSYFQLTTWLQSTSTHGLYFPSSGAGTHFYPGDLGNYGSFRVDGRKSGWGGISLEGRVVFMHNGGTESGIYNDVNNHWLFYAINGDKTAMYHNGSEKIYTYASGGRVTGDFLATGDIYAYYSDERLKDKTGKIENALDKVDAIETFYYTHNDKANELGYDGKDQQVGVSAQSVAEVMPEVVHLAPIDDDGQGNSISGENYQTVNYARLVPLLIESIKELRAEVKDLKEQLK